MQCTVNRVNAFEASIMELPGSAKVRQATVRLCQLHPYTVLHGLSYLENWVL
jgi:hypothetical protein